MPKEMASSASPAGVVSYVQEDETGVVSWWRSPRKFIEMDGDETCEELHLANVENPMKILMTRKVLENSKDSFCPGFNYIGLSLL